MEDLDAAVIRDAARRKAGAFRKVYDHYSPFVWKVVYRTVNGDRDAAGEIVEDVFIKAYYALRKYRFDAAFSTWLYRIAFTTSMGFLARRGKREARMRPFDDKIAGPGMAERIEAKDMIARVLSFLSADERFLLTAREVDNLSFEELEIVTGRSSGSLRTQLSRLKDSLRKEFAHEYRD
jgi:RNA polymerase sigma factor (sigma-70 family)